MTLGVRVRVGLDEGRMWLKVRVRVRMRVKVRVNRQKSVGKAPRVYARPRRYQFS